ncbi:MAG: hypothetical protein Q9M31_04345 [Mariprofundus sp.]|nr:hypothetical protein [Mariprofundus sp.]
MITTASAMVWVRKTNPDRILFWQRKLVAQQDQKLAGLRATERMKYPGYA